MKIGGIGSMGPSMVDSIMEAERAPIAAGVQRKDRSTQARDQFKSFDGILSNFGKSLDGLKTTSAFEKLTMESSHPEIMDGVVSAGAVPGVYELEVSNLAKAERQLAFGFPDRDKTAVGFGYMRVGAGDLVKDVTVEPGSTLNDVAQSINNAGVGVKAMVINTGMKEDPFRLLVSSLESGQEAVMELDPDTTFTEFKQIVAPKDLNVKFEGVDVRRETNKLDNLIEGVQLNAKQAEPGTKIQVEIKHDVAKTGDGIKDFVKQYNEIVGFAKGQTQVDPGTRKAGMLSGESALRGAVRKLQGDISTASGKELSLMDIGITTDPRSGELKVDDAKLTDALSKNYGAVASLFASGEQGPGLAQKLSDSVKQLRDVQNGAVATRLKSMDQSIKNQNKNIERQEERLTQKRAQLEQRFAALDSKMATMEGTSAMLGQRFSAPTMSGGGGLGGNASPGSSTNSGESQGKASS